MLRLPLLFLSLSLLFSLSSCWTPISPYCQLSDYDEKAMMEAISEAALAPSAPFGAVLFDCQTGEIVARGHNACISYVTHGETQAISAWTNQCSFDEKNDDCTKEYYNQQAAKLGLATTGAPCSMCASAIAWMGFGRVVFGSNYTYLAQLEWQPLVPTQQQILDGFNVNPYAKDVSVVGSVLNELTDPLFVRN